MEVESKEEDGTKVIQFSDLYKTDLQEIADRLSEEDEVPVIVFLKDNRYEFDTEPELDAFVEGMKVRGEISRRVDAAM
jgi:hypothetical protein